MFLCDTHSDTLYEVGWKKNNATDITLDREHKGNVALQVMALWTGLDGKAGDVKGIVAAELGALEILKAQGFLQIDDPLQAKEGEVAILLSVEGGEVFEDGIETVEAWRQKGVRMAGITWNHENNLGYPAKGGSNQGLTPYGIKVVKEMQRLKIAVDVSHLNERGFYDIFQKTNVPPLASHSCCAKLRPHFRNLTDDQLHLLIHEGGYVGINFYGEFLAEKNATVETVVDHIDYICQMGGEKQVGFGSDFDGIDVYPAGLRHPGELNNLISSLRRRGYSEQSISGIAGQNLLDYYKRIAP
jgi:membrane dipeptidase